MAYRGRGFRCNLCGQAFKNVETVNQHQKDTNYPCRIDKYLDVQSDELMNSKLLQFHDEKANLDVGARRKSKGVVQDTLNDILESRHNLNRFEREADLEGSYKTGLKIGKPDEFDFSVGLRLPRGHEISEDDVVGFQYTDVDADQGNAPPKRDLCDRPTERTTKVSPPDGYRAVKLQRKRARRFKECVVDGILVPYEVLKEFHQFMYDAVDQTSDPENNIIVVKVARGPAVSLKIRNYNIVHVISVDITPVIYIGEAGDVLKDVGWPREETTEWLSDWKINAILETNIYLVPKGDKFWKISFARCEDELLTDIDGSSVYDGARKTCLRICKMKLKQWKSKSESGMKSISSYMLKTVLLWLCELLPYDEDWQDDLLSARYINFMMELEFCLRRGYLGEYFIPKINLLNGKDENDIAEMLDFIREELEYHSY